MVLIVRFPCSPQKGGFHVKVGEQYDHSQLTHMQNILTYRIGPYLLLANVIYNSYVANFLQRIHPTLFWLPIVTHFPTKLVAASPRV